MIRNFFISALRNLLRNKVFTLLNIGGLVLGIGSAVVLFSFIKHETNYNEYNSNFDRVYRVIIAGVSQGTDFQTSQVPHPLASVLKDELAGAEKVAQLFYHGEAQISLTESDKIRNFMQDGIAFSDEDLFEILDFNWLAGGGYLETGKSVVISRKVAEKYFNLTHDFHSVLGETLVIDNTHSLTIRGIFDDLPEQTDFPFSMIIDYQSQNGVNDYFGEGKLWGRLNGRTNAILLVPENQDTNVVIQQLNTIWPKYTVFEDTHLEIQPLSDMHYNTDLGVLDGRVFPKQASWTLTIVGILLIMACSINFINLSTAKATNRAKEVGIRKVMGSGRSQLVVQHLSETFFIVMLSMIAALAFAELLFKWIEPLIGQSLSLTIMPRLWLISMVISLLLGITLFSGLYPAFIISSFKPVNALKTKIDAVKSRGSLSMRRILVLIQFMISQALLIGTIVAIMQNNFLRTKELGFSHEGIISIVLPEIDHQKTQLLKNEFLKLNGVSHASTHLGSPIARTNNTGTLKFTNDDGQVFEFQSTFKDIDEHYLDLFDIKLLAGRNVSENDGSEVLINMGTVKDMGLINPQEAIGQHLTTDYGGNYLISGVVDDFFNRSFKNEQWNLILSYNQNYFYELALRLESNSPAAIEGVIAGMNKIWEDVYPEYVLNYDFLEESIASSYQAEDRMVRLFRIFAAITIVIGCLGLYGLIDFIAIKKMKEIGIRKVLGASLINILNLFAREMVFLITLSMLIAGPLMYIFLRQWLESYESRIDLGATAFLIAFLSIAFIAILTMGYRSYRASTMNPVLTLKDE